MILADYEVEMIKHCLGMRDKHQIYHRHGKAFYKAWRNTFNTSIDDPLWSRLCELGYAEHGKTYEHPRLGVVTTFFHITAEGREWFGKIIGVTIKGVVKTWTNTI